MTNFPWIVQKIVQILLIRTRETMIFLEIAHNLGDYVKTLYATDILKFPQWLCYDELSPDFYHHYLKSCQLSCSNPFLKAFANNYYRRVLHLQGDSWTALWQAPVYNHFKTISSNWVRIQELWWRKGWFCETYNLRSSITSINYMKLNEIMRKIFNNILFSNFDEAFK